MLDTLAASKDTINCICGLLLLPSPLPTHLNRIVAHILLRLGLHSKDLCLDMIKTVLRNGADEHYKCMFELINYYYCTKILHFM